MRGKGEEEGDKTIQWEGGRREKGKKLSRGRVVVNISLSNDVNPFTFQLSLRYPPPTRMTGFKANVS